MKDKDFKNIIDLIPDSQAGCLYPGNEKATELLEMSHHDEILSFIECTHRDIKFHRAYFSLLNYIYSYLPDKFKKKVPQDKFYEWLKHLKGQYKVLFEFKDGSKFIEYDSISFGKMTEPQFHEYIKEQLPYIYENVIGKFFTGDIYNSIIETIEKDYSKFFEKL